MAAKLYEHQTVVCIDHLDCFANKNSICVALRNNDFGKRDCPFYKYKYDVPNYDEDMEEIRKSRNR